MRRVARAQSEPAGPAAEAEASVRLAGVALETIRQRIEAVLAGRVVRLDVTPMGANVLKVRFVVPRSADAEPLVNRVSEIPELRQLQVDFEVSVGR